MFNIKEQQNNSLQKLWRAVFHASFQYLDAPVEVMGALNLPAVPMNIILEKKCCPMLIKVAVKASATFTELALSFW